MKKRSRMLMLLLAGTLTSSVGVTTYAADETLLSDLAQAMITSEVTQSEDISSTEEEVVVDDAAEEETDVVSEEESAEEPEVPVEELPVEAPEAPVVPEVPADKPAEEVPPQEETVDEAFTGWKEENGNRYYFENNEPVKEQLKLIDDKMYYFNYDGIMETGEFWIYHDDLGESRLYRAGENGVLITGWYLNEYDGYSFYDRTEYYRYSDVVFTDGGYQYYVNESGILVVSQSIFVDGKMYVADANGRLTEATHESTGWVNVGNDWYYFENNEPVKNQMKDINGKRYYFNYDGIMETGEFEVYDEKTHEWRWYQTAENSGALITGWYLNEYNDYFYYSPEEYYRYTDVVFTHNGSTYYVNSYGSLVTSRSLFVEGKLYIADENGRLTELSHGTTGWANAGNDWYYFEENVPVRDQRKVINGETYYFDEYGVMMTGQFGAYDPETGEWHQYRATENGVLISGWYQDRDGGEYYFYDEEKFYRYDNMIFTRDGYQFYAGEYGEILMSDTVFYNGVLYRADAKGRLTKVEHDSNGWQQIDGKWYYLEDNNAIKDQIYTIDGEKYYFNYDGIMETGKFHFNGEHYITDSRGVLLKNQWVKHEGLWYYASSDYTLYSNGIYTIGNERYVFGWSGYMATGLVSFYDEEEHLYITEENGVVIEKEGWKYLNLHYYYISADGSVCRNQWINDHYYVGGNGVMFVGTHQIDGKTYYFDNNGYCSNTTPNFTGWKFMDGYWYYNDANGNHYTGWVGENYVRDGIMVTNGRVSDNGKLYYLDCTGKKLPSGWNSIEVPDGYYDYYTEVWAYANSDGSLVAGEWKLINGSWYYFYESGMMATGATEIDGKTYVFAENGVWLDKKYTGWQKFDGSWYYFYNDGTMLHDKEIYTIGGTDYFFYYDGSLKCDTIIEDYGKIYYLDASGYKQSFTGWKTVGGNKYYLEADGKPADGLKNLNGKYYFFTGGWMTTGNVFVPEWGGYYFFDETGAWKEVTTGWYTDGFGWFYYINGQPVREKAQVINGKTYMFDSQGYMLTGTAHTEFLFDDNGALVKNAWSYNKYNKKWYYADASGRYVYGERTIDGVKYWFDRYGAMIKKQ